MTALLDDIRSPDLPGLATHRGLRVGSIGEPGEPADALIALGHHRRALTLLAFRDYTAACGWQLTDGLPAPASLAAQMAAVRHTWAVLAEVCGRCAGQPDCTACARMWRGWADGRWFLHWDVDPIDPRRAFPITVFEP